MARSSEIDRARESFSARHWQKAFQALAAADRHQPLDGEDVERLAASAYLVGDDRAALAAWTRAHNQHVDAGRADRAAQIGCWISLTSILGGDIARGTGWLSRVRRLLGDRPDEGAAHGYVLAIEALLALGSGASAVSTFVEATAIAERCGDADLLALALLGHGQALVSEQRFADGRRLLDEAMIGISAGDVSPILAGIVYCAVILTCQSVFDAPRAREWTVELDAWCSAQQGLRPFRGQCLVHRSEILQRRGDWRAADDEAVNASRHLTGRSDRIAGYAFYQRGELSRLRGAFEEAGRLYAAAIENGCEPQPGAALLLLARGKVDEAAAAIRGALDVAGEPSGIGRRVSRPNLLGAFVEIQLAAGQAEAAADATDELSRRAENMDSQVLFAEARQARGAVLLATGRAGEAPGPLREAWTAWQRLEMPYEAARVRLLIGRGCDAIGDTAAARPHYEAARAVFARIGAAPDEAAAAACLDAASVDGALGLTRREQEVLELVTGGAGNREIATRLDISEHTVARHMSNIFDKLGVNSRTAASAVAHAHKLV